MTDAPRIWAPRANLVEILIGESRIAATREDDGWWRAPALAPNDDYQISVDGGPPRPDPRSRWQPNGVHGPSRWIDLALEPVTFKAAPLTDAVI